MNLPFLKKKQAPAGPPREEILRSRPVRNPALTWGPDNQGDMVINVPLEKKPWVARLGRMMPTPEVRHIILDDIGADVWELCDGETSVEAIRRRIAEKYQLNHKEAEASLVEHLRQLAKRRLIVAVAGPEDPPEPELSASPRASRPSRNKRKR